MATFTELPFEDTEYNRAVDIVGKQSLNRRLEVPGGSRVGPGTGNLSESGARQSLRSLLSPSARAVTRTTTNPVAIAGLRRYEQALTSARSPVEQEKAQLQLQMKQNGASDTEIRNALVGFTTAGHIGGETERQRIQTQARALAGVTPVKQETTQPQQEAITQEDLFDDSGFNAFIKDIMKGKNIGLRDQALNLNPLYYRDK